MPGLNASKRMTNENGMTLTEVMVSVAILAVLGTLGARTYTGYSERAKYAQSQATMSGIVSSIITLRVAEYKLTAQLTKSYCTFCDQGFKNDGNDLTTTPVPAIAAWKLLGFETDPQDGWGRPIIMDENEFEFGKADCRYDMLWTAGPDGRWEGYSEGTTDLGDDRKMIIPHYKQGPANGCAN